MTTTLADLFDQDQLAAALADRYIRAQQHPALPYTILNYTERAQYERAWTPVTSTCRGLIVHQHTNEVLARPLVKFFNHNEPCAPALDLHAPVVVTDKVDGSLGISYPTPDGPAVATRGSFASTQALHATDLLRARYPGWAPPAGLTVLWEIVYPANRIVVDYEGLDDLVLLGAVDIATGRTYPVTDQSVMQAVAWPGPLVEAFPYRTLAQALAAPPRDGREGLVVHDPATDTRVKIKQDDYVELHRIVTGLSARVVWNHLRDGKPLGALLAPLPEEFHPWVQEVADSLHGQITTMTAEIETAFAEALLVLPRPVPRKEFALRIQGHTHAAALFRRLDGKDYTPGLWRQIDPGAEWRPTTYTEEAA